MSIADRAIGVVDDVLDAAVVPGFTRIGFAARSRLRRFRPLHEYSLAGRTVVLTGPTSGLGRATAEMLAAMGASLVLVGRNPSKLVDVAATMVAERAQHGAGPAAGTIATVVAEMGDLVAVRRSAAEILARHGSIDAVIHNAGALLNQRQLSAQGLEQTIASHVLGPHLLTTLLLPSLRAASGRVITVSSGGMYTAGLGTPQQLADGTWPHMPPKQYDGTKQYAIAKRIQVTLNELWAEREPAVTFAAMHPGWADTPGVQQSIPTFRRITKPLLRSAEQGADTIAWLTADPSVVDHSGAFWCDRAVRPIHRLPGTRRSDTTSARAALWTWCQQLTEPGGE